MNFDRLYSVVDFFGKMARHHSSIDKITHLVAHAEIGDIVPKPYQFCAGAVMLERDERKWLRDLQKNMPQLSQEIEDVLIFHDNAWDEDFVEAQLRKMEQQEVAA